MFRSLHRKLVLIMVLLIVSLMTVVGAFLINSVVGFYLEEFYTQMNDVFSTNTQFVRDLVTETEGEEDDVAMLQEVLSANMGALGVDGRSRNYYILDAETGAVLAGSDDTAQLTMTPNLLAALNLGLTSSESDITVSYMDVAVPVTRGGSDYIIYILDSRQTVRDLHSELFTLIVEALLFGLAISVLLSFLLSKTMITPIERLTDGARRVAEGDFSHRIEVQSRDEIGVLTNTFNNMAGQLQQTLREVENERNKLGTLFLHMSDGVVAFNRRGIVIHANPAAEVMLGQRIPVSGETDYADLFGDLAPISAVLSAEQDHLEGEREQGGRSLELLLAPFDRENQTGVLVLIHDVTERRKTEEMRKEFVANVSHELRTPLTNIRSYAETLAETPDLPPETAQGFLQVILGESDRMTHIVQDLLTLSRFDSGRGELNLTQFSFAAAITGIRDAVALEAQHHGQALTMDLAPDLPDILADRERILQVIMNVVSNALKYTPDRGAVHISAGRAGDRVWMEVADNGIGIPKEDRTRIFERFYRVDKARSRQAGGSGLGLSIAREIVERHEGEIFVVDRAEPGLTMRMELPIGGPGHEA